MSTVLEERPLARVEPQGWMPWAAVLLGLLALYVPTYIDLARGLWREDDYAHGPIILAVFAWLVWRARDALTDRFSRPQPLAGSIALAFGLALYLLGRTQGLAVFEVASHIPVIVGALLLLRGFTAVRRLAFPLLFLLFLIPLPGFVMDYFTVPLKGMVSGAVETLLQLLNYPVVREGVVLAIGDKQMLVADACSGLNSLFSLLALGLVHSQVIGRKSAGRTALLLLAIVPIAVTANIVRVMVLVLVTHHLGDAAARGFLHDFAGLLVFSIAFMLLVGFDVVVRAFTERPAQEKRHEVEFDSGAYPHLSTLRPVPARSLTIAAIAAAIAMVGTAAAAPALKPRPDSRAAPDLERFIPQSFAAWHMAEGIAPVAPAADVQAKLDRLYKQVLSRTYVGPNGEVMMLTVAYGGDQSDALKAHRQEACYRAQGFEIQGLEHGTLTAAGREIPVTRMHAVRGERSEPVTYWFTMGERVVLGRAERLRVQLENGLAGRIPDGMLIRVSSLSSDPTAAFNAQQAFVEAILAAMPRTDIARLVGASQG